MADRLHVRYGRRGRGAPGLRGLTARFRPGITGLVGPNGAGKSTLLRAACGLLPIAEGSLDIAGKTPSAHLSARGVGFLPENPPLPDFLSVREFLAGLAPVEPPPRDEAPDPFGLPGLGELLPRRMNTLSLGQRKKVALAAALSGDPGLLLLDEPTNGLDPLAVRDLRHLLQRLGREGLTVIVSSHHLDELQRMADALVFVSEGRSLGAWRRDLALEECGSFDGLFERVFERRAP